MTSLTTSTAATTTATSTATATGMAETTALTQPSTMPIDDDLPISMLNANIMLPSPTSAAATTTATTATISTTIANATAHMMAAIAAASIPTSMQSPPLQLPSHLTHAHLHTTPSNNANHALLTGLTMEQLTANQSNQSMPTMNNGNVLGSPTLPSPATLTTGLSFSGGF
jgi:hypothetical protein